MLGQHLARANRHAKTTPSTEDHLRIDAASWGALEQGRIDPLQWLHHGLDHGLHDGRWHRHWHRHLPHRIQLTKLMHLSKPRLRWPRMRRHHWLPDHGLPQHQAWLHLLLHLHSGKNATQSNTMQTRSWMARRWDVETCSTYFDLKISGCLMSCFLADPFPFPKGKERII